MSKRHPFIAVLVLALVGLVDGDYESRAAKDANPVRVAEMQRAFRDLWLGHIFMIQHVVLYNATHDSAARECRRQASLGQCKTDCEHVYAVLRPNEV